MNKLRTYLQFAFLTDHAMASNVKSRQSYAANTKLYDVRAISGDWPRSVFGITWVYALTYIRNLLDDYMATPSQKAVATKIKELYELLIHE